MLGIDKEPIGSGMNGIEGYWCSAAAGKNPAGGEPAVGGGSGVEVPAFDGNGVEVR